MSALKLAATWLFLSAPLQALDRAPDLPSLGQFKAALPVLAKPAPSARDDLRAQVDRIARPIVENGKAVGLVVGVIRGAETFVLGYGRTALQGGKTPDGDTLFEIGSNSKVFTGVLLARMIEDGLVSAQQPVQALLPPSVKVPAWGDRAITLLDLTTHTSGLPRLPDNLAPKDENDPYVDYTPQRLYDFLSGHALQRAPGAKYEYSNLAVGLLGHALGLAAGQTYAQALASRVCAPLGLGDTAITLDPGQKARLAEGHLDGKPASNWNFDALAGAGALRSSANDLLKFLAANSAAEGPLASALALAQKPERDGDSARVRVAMGWHVTRAGTTDVWWHGGRTLGYSSAIVFTKQPKTALVLLSNSGFVDEVDAAANEIEKVLISGPR